MQEIVTFLRTILPPLINGLWYVHAAKYGKGFRHTACHSVEDLLNVALNTSNSQRDSYFALASFVQEGIDNQQAISVTGNKDVVTRKTEFARSLKCVWVDIDCGVGKAYSSTQEAEAALVAFMKATKLPSTYVINSGYGLHVYWAFTQPYFISDQSALDYLHIDLATWEQVKAKHNLLLRKELAERFTSICTFFGLKIDAAATDSVRVLRVPGTNNYKHETVAPCTIRYNSKIIYKQSEFNTICSALIEDNNIPIVKRKASVYKDTSVAAQELNKYSDNTLTTDIDKIVSECQQLATMGYAEEPLWRSAICLCKQCEDGREWAHKLSAMDTARYTVETTDEYFDRCIAAPVHCKTFESLRGGICINCPYYEKITSPVQIVKFLKKDTVKPMPIYNYLQFPTYDPPAIAYVSNSNTDFFVDSHGVWQKNIDENGQPLKPTLVTNAVIEYLYSTIGAGAELDVEALDVFRVYVAGSTQAFIRYFPTRILYDTKKIMDWCGNNRLIALSSQKALADFMNAYIRQQVSAGTVQLRGQYDTYGWQGKDQFILDEYAVSAAGATPIAPTQPNLAEDDKPFTHKGSIEEWKKIPQLYRKLNQPLGQLAICLAFAAPFLHYGIGEAKNCVMNIYSYKGGMGKSHLLRACASVYGNPAKAFLQNTASSTATQRYMAMHKHLPIFMDEIGNRTDEDIANLIFTMINGVEKQKLHRNSKIKQTGWWSTAVFTTANKPLKDIMARVFANTDAGVLRVMDCECTFDAPEVGSEEFKRIGECFQLLEENYGLAGPILINCVLQDPALLDTLSSVANAFVVNNKFAPDERFYSYPLAIALTVGRWAVKFGLLDYDMDKLEWWVIHNLIYEIRLANKSNAANYENDLNEFINENLRKNCLIVARADRSAEDNKQVTAMGIFDTYVYQYPTNALNMRYEVENQTLVFSVKAFTDWCMKEKKQPKLIIYHLQKLDIILKTTSRWTLCKGVPRFASTQVRCYVVNPKYLNLNPLSCNIEQPAPVPGNSLTAKEQKLIEEEQLKESLLQGYAHVK